ncbi:hypothetical protein C8F04DRAFT_1367887 [Mycena alexandri]|uniref:Cyclin n=1 Tax=Mycena alexandri TaxID=1745969 RepID=A0AAD6SQW8_9AGAR|nr:hypothetical protein C8F04DRAFT_1367887 [Mycena alexandri]
MAQATLDALPRELAHWTASASAMPPAYTHNPHPHHAHAGHTPMTPPHTDAVEPRRLAAPWGTASAIYAGGNAGGHRGQLLTPPDDTPPLSVGHAQAQEYYAPPPPPRPAPSSSASSTASASTATSAATSTTAVAPDAPDDEPPLAWAAAWLPLGDRRGSAALVAEKTCEMICYLWFAPSTDRESKENLENVGGEAKEGVSGGRGTPSALQLTASPTFVSFTQKLLETTQVSQSVIILALHYIHRLRLRNLATPAQPGSEFRVAVAGLMMGNKFLDDNTYTNATWAAVSLIPLAQINTMEREFLVGCDYSLFVSQKTYEDWGRLLRGLVGARARAAGGHAGRGHTRHRGGRLHPPTHAHAQHGSTTRRLAQAPQAQARRTSVSPKRSAVEGDRDRDEGTGMEVDAGAHHAEYEYERHTREREEREREREREEASTAGSKRRAAAAFSPTSYHPPAHAHGGQNPFAGAGMAATNGYPTTTQVYTHPHHPQQQQGQSQRPAPTLVIPRFSSTPQHRAHGHAHAGSASTASNANANAHVNGNNANASANAYAPPPASAASYASSASSASSSGAGPPAYPSVTGYPRSAGPHAHAHSPAFLGATQQGGIGTPLERFGAMSLSSGGGGGGEGRARPRPVSYAGPSSSSSNSNSNANPSSLSMFGASGTNTFTPYAERERERERGRSIYASGGGGGGGTPARSASYVNVSGYGGTPTTTRQYEYVPPPPSTVVQYPPQYAAQVAASSNANSNSGSHHQQQQHGQQQQTHLPTPTSSSSLHGHGHGSPYGVQHAPHSHSTTSLHASPYGRYSRGGTPPPPPPPPPAAPAASSTATVGGGYAGNQSQSQYAQTHPQTHPQTLTARWDYAGGAGAGHGGIAHQDLYFYALASSPVSSVSSGDSSSDSRFSQSGEYGHARTASYSSNSDSCSSDDDGGLDGDEEMADVEGDDWEGGESDEDEDDDDDDDSARSDDGRGAGVQMRGAGGGWDENVGDAREAARRARLRCVGPPPQMVPSMAGGNASRYHHLPHHPAPSSHPQQPAPHQQFLPSSQQNGLGLVPPTHHSAMPPQTYGAPARWGVQSARTSPVRGPSSWTPPQVHAGLPPRLPHSQSHSSHVPHTQQHADARGAEQWTPPRMQGMQQWTPPRMSHTATAGYGGSEWTPPRVALPRFADLERWSSAQVHVQATPAPAPCPPMQQGPPPQQRETHPHQPRRAVFANAGPPGVSGYAYAY